MDSRLARMRSRGRKLICAGRYRFVTKKATERRNDGTGMTRDLWATPAWFWYTPQTRHPYLPRHDGVRAVESVEGCSPTGRGGLQGDSLVPEERAVRHDIAAAESCLLDSGQHCWGLRKKGDSRVPAILRHWRWGVRRN